MKRIKIKKSSMLWTLKCVKNRIPGIILVTALSVLSGLFGVLFALGTKGVIDSALYGEPIDLVKSAIKLAILIMLMILSSVLSRHVSDKLKADLDRDLKKKFMHKILNANYEEISKYHSGDLVHRLNSDVRTIIDAVMSIFPSFASLIVQTVAIICILANISFVFTAVLLGLCFIVFAGGLLLRKFLKRLDKKINDESGKISGFLQEMISKLLIVQALDVSEQVEEREEDMLEARWQLQRKRKNVGILTSTGLSFLGYIVSFVTLIWCSHRLMNKLMSFGTLTATTQLAGQLEAPVYALPYLLRQTIAMSASAERLIEIENINQINNNSNIDVAKTYESLECISAKELYFSYDRDEVLHNISFSIPKDKMTVITGSSGIGKSTFLKLLLGIYRPTDGKLVFDTTEGEIDISRDTRKLFSYAPQGNLLFSGTLRENLLFATPNATEAQIERAVYVSCLDEVVDGLEEGLDTYLGENASGLSEGQAQRLSLARAILRNAPILLLDEVTSSLDIETEAKVLSRIEELNDRTCIVVTHRLSVLDIADWQIHIGDNGIKSNPIVHG